jgi:hypothetical protein
MSALDKQVAGGHYKDLAIQPVEFAMSHRMGFCEGSVIKYVTRYPRKQGLIDLEKASHFIQFIEENESYVLRGQKQRLEVSMPRWESRVTPEQYCEANGIEGPAAHVIRYITLFADSSSRDHLRPARAWMDELLHVEAKRDAGK